MVIGLAILVSISLVIIYFAVRLISEIEKNEKPHPDTNSFSVTIKYSYALIYLFIQIGILLAPIIFLLEYKCYDVPVFWIFVSLFYLPALIVFMPLRQRLIIKDNQITEIGVVGFLKTFPFESVKYMEIYYSKHGSPLFQLRDRHNRKLLSVFIGLQFNNVDLLVQRLRDAGATSIGEFARTEIESKPLSNDFVVQYGGSSLILPLFMILFIPVMFYYDFGFDPHSFLNVALYVSFFSVTACMLLHTMFYKITYNNGVFEYRNFIGLKRKFKSVDISHVKFSPNVNIFDRIYLQLRTGKRICKIKSICKNFDLFIETLRQAGVEFK